MFRRVFLVLILGLSLSTHSWGATHYVKIGGSDGAAGTSWATAWATISKVNSDMSGGDTVYFGTGTWRGQLLPVSGTAEDRTTYACSSFVQGIASIWGSDSISGWVQHSGNVYKARWVPSNCFGSGGAYVCGQIDVSYDTFLTPTASIPAVEGKFYYNTTTDTIYVWRYGGGSPSISDIEPSCKPVIYFTGGQDYCTFWGFDLRYGSHAIVYFNSVKCDYNYIDHCNIFGVGGVNQDNNSCVYSAYSGDHTVGNQSQHNRVRACSLGFSYDVNMDAWRFGIGLYSMSNFVTESTVVVGGVVDGINYKGGRLDSNIIRFNTIKGCVWSGINFHANPFRDSIYGNIIIGSGVDGPVAGIRCYSKDGGSNNFIANNTIYNTKYAGLESGVEGSLDPPNYYKYNIVSTIYDINNSSIGAGFERFKNADSLTWTIDSNLYFNPDTSFGINWSSRTLTYWRNTLGHDVHTEFYDPGFTDAANGDFSRLGSSQEMDLTYGGKTWTRFGAWQPDGEEENHCPTSPTLNLPVNGDTILGVRPILSLNNSSDPDPQDVLVYDFQVYSDSQLVNLAANEANVAEGQNITSWQTNPELPDESWYWWRTRSYDGICHSEWSEKGKFYVKVGENNCPGVPTLNLPTDEDTILGLRPMLTLNNSVDIDTDILVYDFQVYSDSQLVNLVTSGANILESEDITSWQVAIDLSDESWYWWRVRSYDGLCYSEWSEKRKFYVKKWIAEVGDSQPTLRSPVDGAILTNLRPVLEIYNIIGFDSLLYFFQVDSDSQFTNPIQSEPVTGQDILTSWRVSNKLSTGGYCWRARAFDGSEFSLWSDVGKFSLTSEVYIYPNPFKPTIGDETIVFSGIPIGSDIKVTTLSGELVKKFADTQESEIIWDAKNQEGKDVASGVYLYFVDFVGGSTSDKIVIIR